MNILAYLVLSCSAMTKSKSDVLIVEGEVEPDMIPVEDWGLCAPAIPGIVKPSS